MNTFNIKVKIVSGEDCMVHHEPIKFQYDGCSCDVYRYIENALEEIQQYRSIGTVDKFRQLSEQFKPHITDNTSCPKRNCNKCDMYRKENEKYHAIGTIEECRAAVEKQRAKKSDIEGDWDSDGHLIYDTWICPNCGRDYEINYDYYNYCPNCGQHIDTDWSEEE